MPDALLAAVYNVPRQALSLGLAPEAAAAASPSDVPALAALADDARQRATDIDPSADNASFKAAFVPSPKGRERLGDLLAGFAQAVQAWRVASDHYRTAALEARNVGQTAAFAAMEQAAELCDARGQRAWMQRQVMLGIGGFKRALDGLYDPQAWQNNASAKLLYTCKRTTGLFRDALQSAQSQRLAALPLQSSPIESFDDELGNLASMLTNLLDTAHRMAAEQFARAQGNPAVMRDALGHMAPSIELWLAAHTLDSASLDRLSKASAEMIDVARALRRVLRGQPQADAAPGGSSAPASGASTSTPPFAKDPSPQAGPSTAGDELVGRLQALELEPQQPPEPSRASLDGAHEHSFEAAFHQASVTRLTDRVSPLLQAATAHTTSAEQVEQTGDKVGAFVAWHDALESYRRIAGTLILARDTLPPDVSQASAVQDIKRDADNGLQRSETRMQGALGDALDDFMRQIKPGTQSFDVLAGRSERLREHVLNGAALQRHAELRETAANRLELMSGVFRMLDVTAGRPAAIDDISAQMKHAARTARAAAENTDADTAAKWNQLARRIEHVHMTLLQEALEQKQQARVEQLRQRMDPLLKGAAARVTSAERAEQNHDAFGAFAHWHEAADIYHRSGGEVAAAGANWLAGTASTGAVQDMTRTVEEGLQRSESQMRLALENAVGRLLQQLSPTTDSLDFVAGRSQWLLRQLSTSPVLKRHAEFQQSVASRVETLDQVCATLHMAVNGTPHTMLDAAQRLKTTFNTVNATADADRAEPSAQWQVLAERIHDVRQQVLKLAVEEQQESAFDVDLEVWPHVWAASQVAHAAVGQAHCMVAGDPLPDAGVEPEYLPAPANADHQAELAVALQAVDGCDNRRAELVLLPPDTAAQIVEAHQATISMLENNSVAARACSTIATSFNQAWQALAEAPLDQRPEIARGHAERLGRAGDALRQRIAQQSRAGSRAESDFAQLLNRKAGDIGYIRRLVERASMSLDVLGRMFEIHNAVRTFRAEAASLSAADRTERESRLEDDYDRLARSITEKGQELVAQIKTAHHSEDDVAAECKVIENHFGMLAWRLQSDRMIVDAKLNIDEMQRVLRDIGSSTTQASRLTHISDLAENHEGRLTRMNEAFRKVATDPLEKDQRRVMLKAALPCVLAIRAIKEQVGQLKGASSSASSAAPQASQAAPAPAPRRAGRRGGAGRRR